MCKHTYTSHPDSIRRNDNSLSTAMHACFLFLVPWLSAFKKSLLGLPISFPCFYLKQVHYGSVKSCWECTGPNSSIHLLSSWLVMWWKSTGMSFQEMSFCVFCPHAGLLCQRRSLALSCICRTFSHAPREILSTDSSLLPAPNSVTLYF